MSWLLLAFLTAFFEALKDVFSKKAMAGLNEYALSFGLRLFILPVVVAFLIYHGIPAVSSEFWIALALSQLTVIPSSILYMRAVRISDLSLSVPMIAFTPIFLLFTSPLMVGEFPDHMGVVGILVGVVGAYLMNLSDRKKGILAPLQALIAAPGPRLMLIVAFIWSIGSNIDKIGVQASSPVLWVVSVNIVSLFVMLPIAARKTPSLFLTLKEHISLLTLAGFVCGVALICQMTAIKLTLVAYVISVKRTSAVFGVLFGWLIFKEQEIRQRLLGATFLVIGVIIISLTSR